MDEDRLTTRRRILVLGSALVLALGGGAWRLGPRAYNARRMQRLQGRRVYDTNADADALLAAALARAFRENKRVLVILGGNWCVWCLALDELMTNDDEIRAFVTERLILVKLDEEGAGALDAAWGRPTQYGLPVLVFLEPDGRIAHVQETVSLEAWGGRVILHDRAQVLRTLQRWV